MTRVAVLTPPGTGAIATVAVAGPGAWAAVRTLFRPAAGSLPDVPEAGRFWFGKLGDGAADEVVIAVTQTDPELCVEVHCHGGRQVVRWVAERFVSQGCLEVDGWNLTKPTRCDGWACDDRALEPLSRAPTLRTASILLDQYHGAFLRGTAKTLANLDFFSSDPVIGDIGIKHIGGSLVRHATKARHLTNPYTVAVVGPPNAGKSSLMNAVAGYQRSAVAPAAGTTRDLVTADVAFDGWPVTLTDTAGLRDAPDALEAAGVELTRGAARTADVVVNVFDLTAPAPTSYPVFGRPTVYVANKADLVPAWDPATLGNDILRVSAATGAGVSDLISAVTKRLNTDTRPGEGYPFTPELCDAYEAAGQAAGHGDVAEARRWLSRCLPRT